MSTASPKKLGSGSYGIRSMEIGVFFIRTKADLLYLRLADFPAWKTSNTVQEKPEPFKQPNIMPKITLALTIVITSSFFAARQRALYSTLTETPPKRFIGQKGA